ncbi:MAG: hypothetical protein AB7P03_28640 [Kofleriaceae bacterium]
MRANVAIAGLMFAAGILMTSASTSAADTAYGRQCNRVFPTRVATAFPGISRGQWHKHSCNPSSARAEDGHGAGLDYDTRIGVQNLSHNRDYPVTGCLYFTFPLNRGFLLAGLEVIAKPTRNACGASPCQGGYCGTGGTFNVFVKDPGAYRRDWQMVKTVQVTTPNYSQYKIALPRPASQVMICRAADGPARDDLLIDSVKGCAIQP